jgi:TonB family protein
LNPAGLLLSTALILMMSCGAFAQTTPGQSQTPQGAEADKLNAQVLKLAGEGKNAEALAVARRVLDLRERELGREHPSVASALQNIAVINQRLGANDEAKSFFKRALAIYEKSGDEYTPQLINTLDGLITLEDDIGRAIVLYERSLGLKEKASGAKSTAVLATLFPLGHLYELHGDYDKAERVFARFVELDEGLKVAQPDDRGVALLRLGCLMRKKKKDEEASRLQARAEEIFDSVSAGRGKITEDNTINGKTISKPQPAYPAEAKKVRAQGKVRVRILVSESGMVLSACGEGPDSSLERSSELAAYSARFTPTMVNGKPVKVKGIITYNFVLQ